MGIIETILISIAVIFAVMILGVFMVIAFAINAYYQTDEGQASLQSAKDKKKKR